MNENEFNNLSGKTEGKQTSAQIEQERVRKIEKIKNVSEKRKAHTMLNTRDNEVDKKRAEAEQQIRDKVGEETRKKVAPKAELHIKPPMGAGSYAPQQREHHIETQVRNSLGIKLEQEVKGFEKAENKKIDSFVDKTLEKQRDQDKTTKQKFSENSEEITKSAKERFQEKAAQRKENKTQGEGGGRSRSR